MPPKGWTRPLANRFWARVDWLTDGCWLWSGAKTGGGYGAINGGPGQRMLQAHRVSWELHNGPIPDGLFVLHRCDVRHCVRPEHLFLGTQKDNIQDAVAKGRMATGDRSGARLHPESRARGDRSGARLHRERMPRGERNASAKLTEAEVREIRNLYAAGEYNQHELARRYGVCHQNINNIVRRLTWAHVAEEP